MRMSWRQTWGLKGEVGEKQLQEFRESISQVRTDLSFFILWPFPLTPSYYSSLSLILVPYFTAEVSENSQSREFSMRVSFIFLARPREMIFWSLDLVSKHESNKMESRSRLEIREWSYDNLDLVSPGESKKNNSQSRLEKLHLLSRVGVRFLICIWVFKLVFGCQVEKVWSRAPLPGTSWSV